MKTNQPYFFKTSEEFKKFLPVNTNTSFVTLSPAIITAEHRYILPILGSDLFSDMSNYYDKGLLDDENRNQLINYIQNAVIRYAFWDSFSQLVVQFNENGITANSGEAPVYRYQEDNLKESLHQQAAYWTNEMISYLELNIEVFASFEKSEYFTVVKDSLIKDLSEFNKIISINKDFRIFQRLRPFISNAETLELPARLGEDLCKKIKSASGDSAPINGIMPAIKAFVATWSYAQAIPTLNLTSTASGLMTESEKSMSGGRVKGQPVAASLDSLIALYTNDAERYMEVIIRYIKSHISEFPEYKNNESVNERISIDNRGKKLIII